MNKQIASLSVDTPLRAIFLEEVMALMGRFESSIESLSSRPNDQRLVREIERVAMDIKGISSMVGLDDVATTMRATERLASLLIVTDKTANDAFYKAVGSARDHLRLVISTLYGDRGVTHAEEPGYDSPVEDSVAVPEPRTFAARSFEPKPVTSQSVRIGPFETQPDTVTQDQSTAGSLLSVESPTSALEKSVDTNIADTSIEPALSTSNLNPAPPESKVNVDTPSAAVPPEQDHLVGFNFQDNLNESLVAAFQMEAPQLMAELSESLQSGFSLRADQQRQHIVRAQRAAHTLKGTATIVGVEAVSRIMHIAEDLLEGLVERNMPLSQPVYESLLDATDLVGDGIDRLNGSNVVLHPDPAIEHRLKQWANRVNDRPDGSKTPEDDEWLLLSSEIFQEPDNRTLAVADFRPAGDVHELIVDAFVDELPSRSAKLSEAVTSISQDTEDLSGIVEARRIAHTIKGSASISGIPGVTGLMNYVENILVSLSRDKDTSLQERMELLQQSADCLEEITDSLGGRSSEINRVPAVFEALQNWHTGQIADGEMLVGETTNAIADEPSNTEQQTKGLKDQVGVVPISATVIDSSQPAADIPYCAIPESDKSPASHASREILVERNLRVSQETIDELLRFAGEMSISTVQLKGFSESLETKLVELIRQQEVIQSRMEELNELVHIRCVPTVNNPGGFGVDEVAQSDFDLLEMDEYTEIHSVSNALAETIQDASEMSKSMNSDLDRLENLVLLHSRNSKELTDTVLCARLVQVATIEPGLHRTVRQACRATGKQAQLGIVGSQLRIDSDILASITDALLHLLRNAVDHGIEATDVRSKLGKPVQGKITLRFEQVGAILKIDCADDGAGFDFDRIKQEATRQGLIAAGVELSEDALVRLTWLPGFSTRSEVTELSGRGIGANVIYTQTRDHRGSLSVDSGRNQGATITLTIPLTVISVHTTLIRAGGQVFGVPSTSVEQVIFGNILSPRSVYAIAETFEFENEPYSVVSLADLLNLPVRAGNQEIDYRSIPLFLVESGGRKFAVYFERALDGLPLIIKKLSEYLPRINGVAGATVLGDGSIAPILDLRELLKGVSSSSEEDRSLLPKYRSPVQRDTETRVLIVDDSLSARSALMLIVNDAGYIAETAIDGLDAIEKMTNSRPTVILTDLEMPRMNGLEMTQHIRGDENFRDIPVIMVTSRSTEKHRQQAEVAGVNSFINKPFDPAAVLVKLERWVD